MLYERRVDTFARLMKEVRRLDSDAGIRLLGTYKGRRCLVFVSRSAVGYAAIVCSLLKAPDVAPGRKILAVEFDQTRELGKFLQSLTGEQVQAYVY